VTPQSETPFFDVDEVPASPVDSLGGVISPRQNVMFESVNKGTYEHLPSRVNSVFQSPLPVTY
jgi:hypothetical protein